MVFEFNTKLVGVTFGDRQENIKLLMPGFNLFWKHEKENPYDSNSILCYADLSCKKEIGHLNRDLAAKFVNWFDRNPQISVLQVTGSQQKTQGVNVKVVLD